MEFPGWKSESTRSHGKLEAEAVLFVSQDLWGPFFVSEFHSLLSPKLHRAKNSRKMGPWGQGEESQYLIVTEVISFRCTFYFIALEINFLFIEDKHYLCQELSLFSLIF